MKYLHRELESRIRHYLKIFPCVTITGPRQSGKSTTLKTIFGNRYKYVTFDDPFNISFFNDDPRGFFKENNRRIIFDEAQRVPQIFHYLKLEIDNNRDDYGRYLLTGSSQFTLAKSITESLAGRAGMLSLLPMSFKEVPALLRRQHILYGGYPELVKRRYKNYREWYGAYLSNYIERDVRSLHNIGNLRDFHRLVMLLAASAAQELNMNDLASKIGVNSKTIQSWLSVLEASYIIFLLPPYHNNLGKRIIKRPKVYFYDTGFVCYCTGIKSMDLLRRGPLDGPIFENYVIAETRKNILHSGRDAELFYFRDNLGLECDLIIEDKGENMIKFVEIKISQTPKREMAKNIALLMERHKQIKLNQGFKVKGSVVYRGNPEGSSPDGIKFINYSDFLG